MLDCFVAFAPRNDKKIPLLRHLCAGFYSRIPIGLLPKRSPEARAVETLVTFQRPIGVGIAYVPCL
jgi:hypothetical protein